jgi:5'-3' exonuclease
MSTYILIDSANMYARSRFVTQGSIDIKLGMSLHIMFNSIKKVWNEFNGDHLIFCFEGRSWRKEFYKPYKANREESKAKMTPTEVEEDRLFWETFSEFQAFIAENTNCTILQNPKLEADDLIAGFIQSHPDDQHVIISSDSDFYQLVTSNVRHYNGISETLTTIDGIFDKDGKRVLDKKTSEELPPPDPEWILFEKCIRGDKSDNVFSAYPGVRTKGTKNKVGLLDAYADRHDKGWAWNNIMNTKWVDHNQIEHKVLDDYNRNKILIDLSAQPDNIKDIIAETIIQQVTNPKGLTQVGIKLMKFCNLYDLKKVIDNAQFYASAFQARYPG